MAVDDHFTTAGGQRDVIRVLHEQAPTIRYMHNERMKRLLLEQFPDFVGFHGGILAIGKRQQASTRDSSSHRDRAAAVRDDLGRNIGFRRMTTDTFLFILDSPERV